MTTLLGFATRYWYLIAITVLSAAVVFTFYQWQLAREDVGKWKQAVETEKAYSRGVEKKLKEANQRIDQIANTGTQSYNACQELARTNVGQAFDRGVQFGRASCPKVVTPIQPQR
jgi:hypothetical protein